MLKLIRKLIFVFLILATWAGLSFFVDPFGVFHPDKVRIYEDTSRNENFVKTYHVVSNPEKYNAFLIGSSRVGGLPVDYLPTERNGVKLSWYSLNYPSGTPEEFYDTVLMLLKYNVHVESLVVCFENNAKFHSAHENEMDLQTVPFKKWDKSKFDFYKYFFFIKPDKDLLSSMMNYDEKKAEISRTVYYSNTHAGNFYVPEKQEWNKDYEVAGFSTGAYTEKTAPVALGKISELCSENNIQCTFILNPTFQNVYKKETTLGLYDFIFDVAQNCDFYNFAGLNKYTNDLRYFRDRSHFIDFVGGEMEKVVFGSEEEKKSAIEAASENLPYKTGFGMFITKDNVQELIDVLESQSVD